MVEINPMTATNVLPTSNFKTLSGKLNPPALKPSHTIIAKAQNEKKNTKPKVPNARGRISLALIESTSVSAVNLALSA